MLPRLGLHALRGVEKQDRPVHLRGPRDHVLHVVRVTGAIDVGVAPRGAFVDHVARHDGDATHPLLRSLVDLGEAPRLATVPMGHHRAERGRERRLPMVDVPDGPDVDVRLRVLLDGHLSFLAPGTRPGTFGPRGHDGRPMRRRPRGEGRGRVRGRASCSRLSGRRPSARTAPIRLAGGTGSRGCRQLRHDAQGAPERERRQLTTLRACAPTPDA